MAKKMSLKQVAKAGLLSENPVFRLVLGTCPTLAVTTSALNGVSMGLATTFVLFFSNLIISALKHVIPDKVRIPCYIVIIATFVTIVEMVMQKFLPDLYDSLGVFISLIVVNCIIFARAESFASANPVLLSMADGLFMGLGFTGSLVLLGGIREILSNGTFFGLGADLSAWFPKMEVFGLTVGGFLTFGLVMALINHLADRRTKKAEARRAEARKAEVQKAEAARSGAKEG